MAEERVRSKNLFNFRPTGAIDEGILKKEKEMMEKFGMGTDEDAMNAMKENMEKMSPEEMAQMLEGMMAGMASLFSVPIMDEAVESCNHSKILVPTSHDGAYDVEVLVHTPKGIAGNKGRPCIVYAHGGGAVAGHAIQYKPLLSFMAVNCGVVVFNVDYRLAPGTRAPNNVLDNYEAVKYVSKNAEDLGIDADRICIAGESGGGYITAGTMVKLAQEGEANLVKLAIPIIPMLSDYAFGSREAMTIKEADNAVGQRKIWSLIAGPKLEQMKDDPLLFPGHAKDETLRKMPPTILWSSEFDIYQTETARFAARLRTVGRLLEFVSIPGTTHGGGMMPGSGIWKLESEAWRLAIEEYLIK